MGTLGFRKLGLATTAILLALTGTAGAATLNEELTFLLNNHPQLVVGEKKVLASEKDVDAAFSDFLPKVTLNGEGGWETTENDSLKATGDSPFDTEAFSAGIEVRQNLYRGLRSTSDYESAKKAKDVADLDLDYVRQQLLLEGIGAYLNVEKYSFLIVLAKANARTIKQQLKLEDERVKRGSGIEVDVLQAKSRLQRAKERQVGFEGSLIEAKARYMQVFGKPADDSFMEEAVPPLAMLPTSLDDSLNVAIEKNLLIRNGKNQVEIAEHRRTSSASSYYPTLDAVARYGWKNDYDGTAGIDRSFFGGVELNWEIFSGFLTDAQVGRSDAEHDSSLASLRYAQQKVEEEVRLAWSALITAQARKELLDNAVNIAAEVFVIKQKLRDGGKETALNVLDAENEFYSARISHITALYQSREAVYKLLLAIGELTPEKLKL